MKRPTKKKSVKRRPPLEKAITEAVVDAITLLPPQAMADVILQAHVSLLGKIEEKIEPAVYEEMMQLIEKIDDYTSTLLFTVADRHEKPQTGAPVGRPRRPIL